MTMSLAPADTEAAPRDRWTAIKRGLACRCPACGQGKLFSSFLTVAPECTECGTAFHHHRADDLPAYITILIVGHVVVAGMVVVATEFDLPETPQMIFWPSLGLAMALALIRPVKGAVIGLQWALRMHGFGGIQAQGRAALGGASGEHAHRSVDEGRA